MTQPTLPVLGGGERELKDGDRVRLRNGWIVGPLYLYDGRMVANYDGSTRWKDDDDETFAFWLVQSGQCWGDNRSLDIVTILGPAEETHGGYTTKLCTLPVTLTEKAWERFDIVGVTKTCTPVGHPENTACLLVQPKPVPSPTYTEKLIEAVRKGEVVLPPRRAVWTHLVFEVNVPYLRDDCEKFELEWKANLLGPLPPWKPGMEESIDLATVREAAEVRHGR